MIKAEIIGINPSKGCAIALTEEGEYVLIEIASGDDFELHDEIAGDFDEHPLGGETVILTSTNEEIDVIIQDYSDLEGAQKYLE